MNRSVLSELGRAKLSKREVTRTVDALARHTLTLRAHEHEPDECKIKSGRAKGRLLSSHKPARTS